MKMRLAEMNVGMSANVLIQIMKNNRWEQNKFEALIQNELSNYIAKSEYEKNNTSYDIVNLFYHHGETDAM